MLNIWSQKSGYSYGIIQEGTAIDIGLPVLYSENFNDSASINFSVITGKLPPGLRLQEDRIVGSAFEVPRDTEFRFVIRASNGIEFADRTLSITIAGEDQPIWNTSAGALPLGPNDAYYVLDNSYIDFQLSVIDFDTSSGQELKFFIPSGGGELPPGLILTDSGRIVGWVQPVLAPPLSAGNGNFDMTVYDKVAYDYGLRPNNGYDTFIFDSFTFDYNIGTSFPKKLNRNFEFNVIVTDGDTSVARKFRIYVVGDDHFRADNTYMQSGNGTFTADVTYARAPIWTTPSYLGIFRANNYKTFKLDTYEGLLLGPITYSFESVNPDIYGQAYTTIPSENKSGQNKIRVRNVKGIPLAGQKIQLAEYVTGASFTIYTISLVTKISDTEYVLNLNNNLEKSIPNLTHLYFGSQSILPPGMLFDPFTAEVVGNLPYQPAITKQYRFTIKATRFTEKGETASAKRTFTADIIGEIDSNITWLTDSDLGILEADYISNLFVKAKTTLVNVPILYYFISGSLPPGLSFNFDGEIIGKINQFGEEDNPGLITFDDNTFILDDGTTTLDKEYYFTIEARDIVGYTAIQRTFKLRVDTPNDRLFSNLIVKPFLKLDQREYYKEFINDPDIFDITAIYRPNDPNFGLRKNLEMLIYAGIETKSADEVVSKLTRNHRNKRFKFGEVKKAIANFPFTTNLVYEVIYVEMFDPLEKGSLSLPSQINVSPSSRKITVDQDNSFYNGDPNQINPYWNRPDPFHVTVDQDSVFAGDPNSEIRFPSSVKRWRERITTIGINDYNYLPLWMRTIQEGDLTPLRYIKAVPICFCKAGKADDILLNIKKSNFDFKNIDFYIDRYIIDKVTGYTQDKYIAFKNDRTTING
jgi:hypothetical protein